MEISIDEFSSLSKTMEDRLVRISELEAQLLRAREERDKIASENRALRMENDQLKMEKNNAEFRANYLREYIILSAEKIRDFVLRLKSIDRWAFLRSFVMWVLPDEIRSEEMKRIEEVMALPPEEPQGITMNNPTVQGPMYGISGNSNVNVGGLTDGEEG